MNIITIYLIFGLISVAAIAFTLVYIEALKSEKRDNEKR